MAVTAVKASSFDVPLPIIGSILDGLMDRVNNSIQQVINSATSGVLSMEVEAGRQVANAIQNAKEAYADSLDKTTQDVNKLVTDTLGKLTNMVLLVETDVKSQLAQVAADAQQLVLSLPFSKQNPQLTSIAPQYVVISTQNDTVLVKFSGVFPWSADSRYPTTFTLNGQACPIFQNTTQVLMYRAPVGAFTNTSIDKCAYVMGNLQVKWSNGWMWPFERTNTAQYNTGLAVLPLSPGKITAYYMSGGFNRVPKDFQTVCTRSAENYPRPPTGWLKIPVTVPPELGWHIDTSVTPTLALDPAGHINHGNHTEQIISYDENSIQIEVGLQNNGVGQYVGVSQFFVNFREYQDQPLSNIRSEPVVLRWGDSIMLQPRVGETVWKVNFVCFDGTSNDFGPADIGNKYLQLINENNTIRLVALVPDQIQP